MFDTIRQSGVNYYNQLPEEIGSTIAKSAFYTFTISVFWSGGRFSSQQGDHLVKAGLAAVASTIHALLTPMFNQVFGTNQAAWHHEIAKSTVVSLLTSSAFELVTTSSVTLATFHFYNSVSSNFLAAWLDNNVGSTTPASKTNSIYIHF